MNGLLQDLRYGFRMLSKKPGFTLIAVMPERRVHAKDSEEVGDDRGRMRSDRRWRIVGSRFIPALRAIRVDPMVALRYE